MDLPNLTSGAIGKASDRGALFSKSNSNAPRAAFSHRPIADGGWTRLFFDKKNGSSRLVGKDRLDVFCWEGVAAGVLNW
ncbi:hypothetical protein [Rugamonas violacea]|uniref:hypothetical protein n=1 Tax=Rugamonas sp. CCM 8940 TaxID=2765359 RepID=UPI003671462D